MGTVITGVLRETEREPVAGGGRLLVIVPAYNEAGAVGGVVRALGEKVPGCDVLVVDDGSTDATAAQAAQAGAHVVRLPYNLGIGGAVQTGFVYAREHGYDYAVQVDGDGQHEPSEIPTLVAAIQADPSLDMVCGSRFLSGPGGFRSTAARRTGIRLFALILTAILRQRITDPTSGFRLCNRRAIALFARDYPHDYPEVEAMLMLHAHRLRLAEVPVQMHTRTHGRSSINSLRSVYYMTKVSLALLAGLMRQRPVVEPGDPAPV